MDGPDQTPMAVKPKKTAIPTNYVLYKGRRIPARIDPEARVGHVVEVMAISFDAQEHPITLALRDEADVLVTQTNLPSKVKNHDTLKLVASSASEALDVINSLQATTSPNPASPEDPSFVLVEHPNVLPLKLALFNLQKYIKEEDFAVEFMLKGGMRMLVKLLLKDDGGLPLNSLAYALQGVRGILEFEHGWGDLSDSFIDRILSFIATASLPNVLRPATAIARKLVISSPQLSSKAKGKGKVKKREEREDDDSVNVYGFDRVYTRMKLLPHGSNSEIDTEGLLGIVLKRLEGGGDLELAAQSLGLVNALMRSAYQEGSPHYDELVRMLDHLSIRRYVSRLMPTCSNNIVRPQLLSFQARYATAIHHRRLQQVQGSQHPEQETMLQGIWDRGRLGEGINTLHEDDEGNEGSTRSWAGWKRLGWDGDENDVEDGGETGLFRDVGELGLECLSYFATHEENFYNLIMEQEAKPLDRQFPLGSASSEAVKILCEHYKINQGSHLRPSQFQLFLLNLPRLHHLVLRFFLRMWQESESRSSDFQRLTLLVRSQLNLSLTDESSKTWLDLERDFLETDYKTIRDRQMEMMEKEDGMMTSSAVRELKEKLAVEAYEIMGQQRVGCMLQGSWFNSATLLGNGVQSSVKANPTKPLRFLKLSANRRSIAWDEFTQRPSENPAFESLRERIEVSNISDIKLSTGYAVNSRSQNLASKLSFSLMCAEDLSLIDLDAVHAAQLAEWTDGIRVLRGEGGMATQASTNYVHILTELALKVRLLDITGDGVEIPEKVSYGPPPKSVDFWFAK